MFYDWGLAILTIAELSIAEHERTESSAELGLFGGTRALPRGASVSSEAHCSTGSAGST